ncbi:DNA helicase-2 / ATP-dependent DNA helicase PcrA [Haloechinothrix alba]|uniref:DNA 3'-5' helicase n=1 Tax=Haloechinothrix alba TaxID=664784 RepID=A0A238WJV7_9PSEU|nr:ATP-dependent helicase [Haloechinothrix alba]SNR46845.1 DNA helicase-2 / ATP-dependent DNA helicase PcrA [Haloechinothrix alba]
MKSLTAAVNELRANERQWQAFLTEGHCVVLAPPGSGKTKLLATRIAYDLATRIASPHGAACVTLTNAAAAELRDRVGLLGPGREGNLFIGTVHSFVLNAIVLPFASLAGRADLQYVTIAGTSEIDEAFESAVRSEYREDEKTYDVKSTINVLRNRLATDVEWAKTNRRIRAVADHYVSNLHQRGLIDFTELVHIAVEFVENHQLVRTALMAGYPHLYVDEYQDLAPGLHRLVGALCFEQDDGSELFAVGDPDQAVFGFTGAEPEFLAELSERHDVETVTLQRNYRCGEEIARMAHNMKQSDSSVIGNHEGGTATVTCCPQGFGEQCEHAASRVLDSSNEGSVLQQIVVICPTNALCAKAADIFRQCNIPVFYRNAEHYRFTEATSFVEGCASWAVRGRELSKHRLGELLSRWRGLCGKRDQIRNDTALTTVLAEYAVRGDERAHRFLGDILDAGLSTALKRPALVNDAQEIARMKSALTNGALKELTVRELGERSGSTGRVEITTMQSSKGLEFDTVMILGMDQKLVPHFGSIGDAKKMAEERRKFYVSLTRARNRVHIYYSGHVDWSKRRVSAGPSVFLKEIGLVR